VAVFGHAAIRALALDSARMISGPGAQQCSTEYAARVMIAVGRDNLGQPIPCIAFAQPAKCVPAFKGPYFGRRHD
jgi:hypothetical protein